MCEVQSDKVRQFSRGRGEGGGGEGRGRGRGEEGGREGGGFVPLTLVTSFFFVVPLFSSRQWLCTVL